ncbi:hypothetical protein ONZ43_g3309 [Nemania bipapillata]|uniref:Uncharacterized protein n=1 Tax=Nemania bipapillata TaxID=110536 RepID=A0ACC2IXE7_9PEZI|nr:hypothetical protein ONZ43_g3309 [Nemania bipapillata]
MASTSTATATATTTCPSSEQLADLEQLNSQLKLVIYALGILCMLLVTGWVLLAIYLRRSKVVFDQAETEGIELHDLAHLEHGSLSEPASE